MAAAAARLNSSAPRPVAAVAPAAPAMRRNYLRSRWVMGSSPGLVLSREARPTDRSGPASGIDRVVYSAVSAGALSAQRRISVLDGLLSSSIFCAVATPATGRSFGSSTPIWARTEAWSQ